MTLPRIHAPRSFAALPLVLGLALAGCGDAPEPEADAPDRPSVPAETDGAPPPVAAEPADRIDPAAICDTINNTFRCARAIEERALPLSQSVERRQDTLRLALAGGDTALLVDRPGVGSGVIMFSYQDHWTDRGYFILQQQYYEGSEYLLVDDETGDRTTVPERPLRAPGGQRFAVLSFDLEAGYGPNTLQIWQLAADGPRLDWETSPDTWGPTDGRWAGPETLEFTRSCPPGGEEGTECGGTATVTRSGDTWVLETGPAGS